MKLAHGFYLFVFALYLSCVAMASEADFRRQIQASTFQRGYLLTTNASGARVYLGIDPGTDVQAFDLDLLRIANVTGVAGDIFYRDATGWTNLAKGSNGQFLTLASGLPAWSSAGISVTYSAVTNALGLTGSTLTFLRSDGTQATPAGGGGGGGDALVANPLSQFAATTSAQLAGVLNDETGTGLAVFSASPALTGTPTTPNVVLSDSSTTVANTAFVKSNITALAAAPNSATYITQTADGTLTAEQALSSLSSGIMRVATTTGVITSLTDSAGIAANISDETGSGPLVFATSPTLTTPVIGVATATSVNKVAITAPATSATLTIADGKTATVNNSITFAGTDSTTQTFPATSGTVFSSVTKADVLEAGEFASDAGSTDTYAATLSPAITAYVTGARYRFKANTANTGACTINFNSLGAKSLVKVQGGVTTTPADNDIRAGQWVDVVYDGTNMQIQSTLGNSGAGTGDALVANPLSQFAATTSAQLAGVISDETGSGVAVFATSPTLTTPTIGVATATSVNKVAITAPATSATLTIADGKTLTANNSLTLAGTDSTTQTFPATSGTVFTTVTKADVLDAANFAADAGANDTYTATLSPAITAYVTGNHYRFKANTANTGASTINLNSVGAKTIKKAAGGITTDLADNDIRAGQWVDVVYDGTNMQMQSLLGNAPAGGGGGGTITNGFGTTLAGVGGAAITTGVQGYTTILNSGTITGVTMLANTSGSIVVDLWKCTYSQFDAGGTHPVVGDKITASAPPTITSTYKSTDTTLTGWTTTVTKGDVIAWSVTSASTISSLNIQVSTTYTQ